MHADLISGTVRDNRSLRRDPTEGGVGKKATDVVLGDVDSLVLVRGRFRVGGPVQTVGTSTEPMVMVEAPYGDNSHDTGGVLVGQRVRLECAADEIRRELLGPAITAQCLGRVSTWDEATGTLIVIPLAIFR